MTQKTNCENRKRCRLLPTVLDGSDVDPVNNPRKARAHGTLLVKSVLQQWVKHPPYLVWYQLSSATVCKNHLQTACLYGDVDRATRKEKREAQARMWPDRDAVLNCQSGEWSYPEQATSSRLRGRCTFATSPLVLGRWLRVMSRLHTTDDTVAGRWRQ